MMNEKNFNTLKSIQNSMAFEGHFVSDEVLLGIERGFQDKGFDQQMAEVCQETERECERTGGRYDEVFFRLGRAKWGAEFPRKLPS